MFRLRSSAAQPLCFVISSIGVAALLLSLGVLALPAQAQTFNVIHEFQGPEGWGPESGLTIDAAGNLYGTTYRATNQPGTVYRMKPSAGGWLLNTLLYFNADDAGNGLYPDAGVVFGPGGALYGTTSLGGDDENCLGGCGVFYALRPPQNPCRSVQCLWTESVPYRFTGQHGAFFPGPGNLLFDRAGNIYGTTKQGGDYGSGTVYELTKSNNGFWIESVIYSFPGSGSDGYFPAGGLVVDSAGNLYGTTTTGGSGCECGIVFELSPSGSGWTETVIHQFQGPDGSTPYATLTLGPSGEIYGATAGGGSGNAGVIFEMSPSGGSWSYSVLYQFQGTSPGGPNGPLVLDAAGDLYGTAAADGAYGFGSVFKLTPGNGGWSYTSLHDFTELSDGAYPLGGPTLDSHGNLYGTAAGGGSRTCGGSNYCGTVWEITP
jgi:uncharacterized repeat protein (TIGR03803 family)